MIRPWEEFAAVNHQITVEYVDILRRSRGVLVAEIGTTQKYPEILSYSGTEIHLWASERTPEHQYDKDAPASSVIFPRAVRGWDVITPRHGRYSIRVALYKPGRRHRDKLTLQNEEWRIALLTAE